MFASILHAAALVALFLSMAIGGLMTAGGAYAGTIYKGATRAAEKLTLLCWLVALIGVLVFILAAAHFVPLVFA